VSAIVEIPLTPSTSQQLTCQLGAASYQLTVWWNNADQGGWTLDIDDGSGNAIVTGIPMITGADLLEQYGYLGIGGALYVYTDADYAAAPTFDNLGVGSHLAFVPAA
jgi:hypothetical protein